VLTMVLVVALVCVDINIRMITFVAIAIAGAIAIAVALTVAISIVCVIVDSLKYGGLRKVASHVHESLRRRRRGWHHFVENRSTGTTGHTTTLIIASIDINIRSHTAAATTSSSTSSATNMISILKKCLDASSQPNTSRKHEHGPPIPFHAMIANYERDSNRRQSI